MTTEAFVPIPYDGVVQLQVDTFLHSPSVVDRGITDMSAASDTLTLFEATAAPIDELMYAYGVDLPQHYFFDVAAGPDVDAANLDRLVENFTFGRVKRIQADTAAGAILFQGVEGTTIPDGALFVTPAGVQVQVLGSVQILAGMNQQNTGAGQAVLAGSAGNLPAGTQLTPLQSITGLTDASVPTQWSGGLDAQTNQQLLDTMIKWLDTLARGTVPAIEEGCNQAGYPHVYVTEPGTGRMVAYVDDGGPANADKLQACYDSVFRFWRCCGVNLKVKAREELPNTIQAHLPSSPTVDDATLRAAVQAAWAQVYAQRYQGDGMRLLDLYKAAASVPGYNGVNILSPTADLVAAVATDEYNTQFGPGDVLPYQKLTLAGVEWV